MLNTLGHRLIGNLFAALFILSAPFAAYADPDIAINDGSLAAIEEAKLLASEGNAKAAAQLIDQVIESAPNNALAHFEKGNIYGQRAQEASFMFAAGLAHQSLKGFRRAVELQGDKVDYRYGLMSFYLQAPRVAGGNRKLAKEQLAHILQLDPVVGFRAQAEWFEHTKQKDKLREHYKHASETALSLPNNVFTRAMFYQSEAQYNLALNDFKRVVSQVSNSQDLLHAGALYQIARTSVFGGVALEQGIAAMQKYIDTAPDHAQLPEKAWARFRLAQIYVQQNELDQAQQLLNQAEQQSPEKQLLKEIRKVRKSIAAIAK